MPQMKKKLTANEFFNAVSDEKMPMKIRGTLATLQSMEIGEDFTLEQLAETVPDGYTSILSYVRALERMGYLERTSVRNERGNVTHSEYRLYCGRGL